MAFAKSYVLSSQKEGQLHTLLNWSGIWSTEKQLFEIILRKKIFHTAGKNVIDICWQRYSGMIPQRRPSKKATASNCTLQLKLSVEQGVYIYDVLKILINTDKKDTRMYEVLRDAVDEGYYWSNDKEWFNTSVKDIYLKYK